MPNEELPVPLFRAYLRRKPSGLLLVTVLSPSLPRPVFRSYPADVGEAEAVARAVGRALSIRVNADQRDQRNNAEAEHKVHGLAPASGVDCCGHHSPEEAHHRHGQPEDRLVAVEGDEATQHRRPLVVRVTWQGLLWAG